MVSPLAVPTIVAGIPAQVITTGGGGGGGGPGGSGVGGSGVGRGGGSCPPSYTSESRFVLAASCSCSCSCVASSSCRPTLAASWSSVLSCSIAAVSSPNSLLSSSTLSSADESWTEVEVLSIISSAKEEEGDGCANAAVVVCNDSEEEDATPADIVSS
jgi:hypothetical protein